MKYFTKEYIKECDCREIQGLKPKLEFGDFGFNNIENQWESSMQIIFICDDYQEFVVGKHNKNGNNYDCKFNKKNIIYLPTGDQLDEEIKQFCMENPLLRYEISWIVTCWEAYILEDNLQKTTTKIFEGSDNPLLAKIKLLKQLIKER